MDNNTPPITTEPAKKPRPLLKHLFRLMMFIMIAGLAAVIGFSYLTFAERTSALQDKITNLSEENTALKTVPPPPPAVTASPEPEAPAAHALEMAAPPPPAPPPARDTARAIIAVVELREAIREGGPFTKQLATVQSTLYQDESTAAALNSLQPLSEDGVGSRLILQQKFTEVKKTIIRITDQLPENPSLAERLKHSFSKVIKIRKINQKSAGEKDSLTLLHEAESAALAGNIKEAARALASIQEDELKQAASSWLEEADQLLTAEKAVATLYSAVTSPSYTGASAPKGMPQ